MTRHTDTNAIEAGIEHDRTSLASALDALQERVSVEHLAQEALGMIRSNAATYTRSIDGAVRANPLALALTGVGIAWLVFGSRKTPATTPVKPTAISRWEDDGGSFVAPEHPPLPAMDDDWSRNIETLRGKASAALRRIENEARRHADDLRAGVADGLTKAGDYAAERAAVLADFAEGMKRGFVHGLDGLSDAARDRIVQTRERAFAARLRAERAVTDSTRNAGRLIEDHPMVAGAIALAMGAVLAAVLPRTQIEDRSFGSERDRLMDEAARLLRQERDRASRAAEGVKEELRGSAKEALGKMSQKVSEVAERVMERSEAEAATDQQTKSTDRTEPMTTSARASSSRRIG